MNSDYKPDEGRKAVKNAFLGHSNAVLAPDAEHPQNGAEKRQLDVSEPHGPLGTFENLLEVNAGKAGRDARNDDCDQPFQGVLFHVCYSLLAAGLDLDLNDRTKE